MTAILGSLAGRYVATGGGGGGGGSISITDQNIFNGGTGSITASYSINSDGRVRDQSNTILETWLLSGVNSSYEVRATLVSGTLTSGTTGSWLACSTTRTWSVVNSASDNSVKTVVLTVEIRLASTGVVQDSATITLSAESDNFN